MTKSLLNSSGIDLIVSASPTRSTPAAPVTQEHLINRTQCDFVILNKVTNKPRFTELPVVHLSSDVIIHMTICCAAMTMDRWQARWSAIDVCEHRTIQSSVITHQLMPGARWRHKDKAGHSSKRTRLSWVNLVDVIMALFRLLSDLWVVESNLMS